MWGPPAPSRYGPSGRARGSKLGVSRNIGRAALAASRGPQDPDSEEEDDDAMSDDGSASEDFDSSDDEEFEVAIDDDCSCAACRWNLERSREWESQNKDL